MVVFRSPFWLISAISCVGATVVVAAVDSWRSAVLALFAGGAIAVTRIRFASLVGVGLVAVTALLVLAGYGMS